MFKVVVFDMDGTLIDSISVWLSLFKKILKKYGIDVDERYIKNQFGKQDKEIISSVTKKEEVFDFFEKEKNNKIFLDKFKIFPFVRDTLCQIKRKGIKVAIVTGNNKKMLKFLLKKFHLNELVDYSVCAEEVDKGKPNPEMLFKVLEVYRVNKEDVIYVGDAPYDVEMAKNAGVKIMVVLTGVLNRKLAEKLKPDFIFEDVRGVLKLL